jgi:hypothetical protein
MIFNSRFLYLAYLVSYVLYAGGHVFAQTSKDTTLTRDEVVIVRNKPSIYLCVDRELLGKNKEANNNLWLRINNNTIWTIRFKGENRGTLQQLIKLPTGTIIAGLSNDSIVSPQYQFESKKVGDELYLPKWGNMPTVNWLPSGTSVLFKVPKKYFNGSYLFIEYNYDWEFRGVLEHESDPPIHRVYFYTNDLLGISGRACE